MATLLANIIGGVIDVAAILLNTLSPSLDAVADAVLAAFQAHGGALLNKFTRPATIVAQTAFQDQADALTAQGVSTPDTAEKIAAAAMGNAFGLGLASAGVAASFEAIFPEKLNTFDGIAPILGEMAGFKEVAANVLDPLYQNAFGKSLEYHYRSLFKPELPDERDAVRWHSQRLLTDDQLRGLFQFSGLKPEYEDAFVTSAYRAIQPRALTNLYEDTPFPRAQVQNMMEFAGVRPADVQTLLDAYEYQSTKNVRHQYLSALLVAAERGTIDDTTLDSHLDTLNFSSTAKNYVHLTVSIRKLEQLAELYRKQVTTLYETGQIDDSQYVPALSAIGIADADAEAHYAVDSAKLKGKELAAQARAAAQAAEQYLRAQIAAIRQEYLNS